MHSIFYDNLMFHEQYHYFCVKNTAFQVLNHSGFTADFVHQILNVDFEVHMEMKNQQFSIDQHKSTMPFSIDGIAHTRKGMGIAEALEACRKQLSKKTAVIASADTYYLPYRVEYKKKHACHSVIITDITNTHVYLVDWYPPHFFKGAFPISQWELAWSSENPYDYNPFSGRPIDQEWFTIDTELCKRSATKLRKTNVESLFEKDATIYSIKLLMKILFFSAAQIKKHQMLLFHDALFMHYRSSKQAILFLESLNGLSGHVDGEKILSIFYEMSSLLERINNQFLLASAGATQRRINRITDDLKTYIENREKLTWDMQRTLGEICNDQKNGITV